MVRDNSPLIIELFRVCRGTASSLPYYCLDMGCQINNARPSLLMLSANLSHSLALFLCVCVRFSHLRVVHDVNRGKQRYYWYQHQHFDTVKVLREFVSIYLFVFLQFFTPPPICVSAPSSLWISTVVTFSGSVCNDVSAWRTLRMKNVHKNRACGRILKSLLVHLLFYKNHYV